MKTLTATMFVLALALVHGAAFSPALAQDDVGQEAGAATTTAPEDGTQDETLMEKLEKDFKETTTPTDEETDPIGSAEDAGRDLY
ncbi:MAG: hypothetical protein KDJ72_01790 [Methyloceanibacter sp.]|uniref:hypothetical protein n=1 Tax=Methyloceanibacter sp. TaxID=1965321 RepID=UPI001D8840D6|nr:hypothetical protein [Methyloceanibacter sp.]MCB1441727.1 hypothetical protein [Methyloceanibacter sp.]MCC0057874.1 hypothetical protein [Hyphomicrobiaceae bacterium]